MAKKQTVTKADVKLAKGLFWEWRQRLHLMDWKVKLHLLTDEQMDTLRFADDDEDEDEPVEMNTALGVCEPTLLRKYANVYLRSPSCKAYQGDSSESFEATLVHELMHIHFTGMPDALIIIEEQNVETLTHAFLDMKYETKETK